MTTEQVVREAKQIKRRIRSLGRRIKIYQNSDTDSGELYYVLPLVQQYRQERRELEKLLRKMT